MERTPLRFYVLRAFVLCVALPFAQSAHASTGSFDVGGLVFTDFDNPLFSGLNGVAVTLEGIDGTPHMYETTTSGDIISGFWVIEDVFAGTYLLSMELDGWCFERYIAGRAAGYPPVVLIIQAGGERKFGNLFFLATPSVEQCLQGCTTDAQCDDFYTCTLDTCTDSLCTNMPIQDCVCNVDLDCEDENPCTAHTCVDNACSDTDTCGDGDVCNGSEMCGMTGECIPGEPLICDDNDACNGMELCDQLNGCVPGKPLICDGGDVCSGFEQCDSSAGCVPGPPLDCDDNNVCTGIEQCDPAMGCMPGAPLECDDEDLCNGTYTCDPQSGCVEITAPVECGADEQCDPADGLCKPTLELPAVGSWPMLVLLGFLLVGVLLMRPRNSTQHS